MHIAMATVGTEGDIRPFVAVALGLVRAGHRVTIATHTDYEEMIASRGLGFRPIGASFKKIVESEAGRAWIESGDSLFRYLRCTRETFDPLIKPWAEDAYRAASEADAVIAHPYALGATFAAEKNGTPAMFASLPPIVPSGEIEPLFWPRAPRWGWLRRQLTLASLRGIGKLMLPQLNVLRAQLGLEALPSPNLIAHRDLPVVHLYSEAIVPRPSDWPANGHVTGFCFLDEPAWTPPDDLVRFVERGASPPLYLGFGSMTGKDPRELAELAIGAVRRTGQRAVLVTGWGGLQGASGEDLYVTNHVPHDWLLPRVRAVVHHGGAGTSAAGLRAKRPTLIVAFFGDQPFWGHRLARLGVGPTPLMRKDLTEESLANGIRSLLETKSYATEAARVGALIAAEDGVAAAVSRIERVCDVSSRSLGAKVAS